MRRGPRPGSSGRLYLPSKDGPNEENMRLQREAEEGRQLEAERKDASWYAAKAAAEAAAAEKERKEEMRKKRKKTRKKQVGGKKRRKKRKKTRKKHKTRRGGNKKAKKYWGMSITKRWKKNPLSFIFPKTNWWYQTAKFGIPL